MQPLISDHHITFFISDKKLDVIFGMCKIGLHWGHFVFCYTVVMDRKVKIRTDLFFVRIITLDFMFDVKWEKSSCLISINSESRRNSLLFWADTGSSFQSPFLIKVWNAEVLHWRIKACKSRRLQFSLADMIFRNYTYCICVVRWYICI